MQYTKLGFNWLFKGCSSHQVPCSLIGNRSVVPNFAYCRRLYASKKKDAQPFIDIFIYKEKYLP